MFNLEQLENLIYHLIDKQEGLELDQPQILEVRHKTKSLKIELLKNDEIHFDIIIYNKFPILKQAKFNSILSNVNSLPAEVKEAIQYLIYEIARTLGENQYIKDEDNNILISNSKN